MGSSAIINEIQAGMIEARLELSDSQALFYIVPRIKTGSANRPTISDGVPIQVEALQMEAERGGFNETGMVDPQQDQYMVSASGLTGISTEDVFRIGTRDYPILKVEPFAPAGDVLYYVIEIG